MDSVVLLVSLVALFGALFLSEYLTRPRSSAWYTKRMKKALNRHAQVIGERLVPAFAALTAATTELVAAVRAAGLYDLEDKS